MYDEAQARRQDLVAILKQKLQQQPDEAAECIQLSAKFGEATESLQVRAAGRAGAARHAGTAVPGAAEMPA